MEKPDWKPHCHCDAQIPNIEWRSLTYSCYETLAHGISVLKLGVFINLHVLLRKEDLLPRGCELRIFGMEIVALLKTSTMISIKNLYRDQTLFLGLIDIHVWTENTGLLLGHVINRPTELRKLTLYIVQYLPFMNKEYLYIRKWPS